MARFIGSREQRRRVASIALLAAVLAGCTGESTFTGTVIDGGAGARLCGTVMESYPPQCGDGRDIADWDWAGIDHHREQTVRWGTYTFTATGSGDDLTLVGEPTVTDH